MPSEYPKIRADLVTSEVTEADQTCYVVKDPVTRRFFRFREHEHFILQRLTGANSLEQIRQAYESRFATPLSAASLERFLERMEALCLLDKGLAGDQIAKKQRKASTESRLAARLLQVRLRAVDPDRFLSAIAPRTRFFFTWQFVVLVAAATVVGTALTAYRWHDYAGEARTLFRPESIPTFVLVVFVVTALHELAHGLTCKHYGGEVREIGFLLIYLVPALYCNVSDAWLFKGKGKRIWVSAAGTFFQVFLYAVAAIIWFFVDRGSWASEACAITIAVAGLTALFNFNPLIKLDGYYMLSDYLEIPNLRKRAFAYLWSLARQVGFRRDRAGVQAAPAETPRQRAVYLTYGISAGIYSLGLLAFVVFQIGGFVVSVFRAP